MRLVYGEGIVTNRAQKSPSMRHSKNHTLSVVSFHMSLVQSLELWFLKQRGLSQIQLYLPVSEDALKIHIQPSFLSSGRQDLSESPLEMLRQRIMSSLL